MSTDVERIATAADDLDLAARDERWCHLSLCIIDDVFSIGVKYGSTWRAAKRYAARYGLAPALAPAADVEAGAHRASEEPLSAFLERVGRLDPNDFATILRNTQRTSTRGGILKADAVQRFARILVEHDVERLADVSLLLRDLNRTRAVERALSAVPGHGSGIRVSYLWMLAGDDHQVKADRMVLRWITYNLGRPVGVQEATSLVEQSATHLGVTPWVLDHAIWNHQRSRRG